MDRPPATGPGEAAAVDQAGAATVAVTARATGGGSAVVARREGGGGATAIAAGRRRGGRWCGPAARLLRAAGRAPAPRARRRAGRRAAAALGARGAATAPSSTSWSWFGTTHAAGLVRADLERPRIGLDHRHRARAHAGEPPDDGAAQRHHPEQPASHRQHAHRNRGFSWLGRQDGTAISLTASPRRARPPSPPGRSGSPPPWPRPAPASPASPPAHPPG